MMIGLEKMWGGLRRGAGRQMRDYRASGAGAPATKIWAEAAGAGAGKVGKKGLDCSWSSLNRWWGWGKEFEMACSARLAFRFGTFQPQGG
jgi:hypothetical protein